MAGRLKIFAFIALLGFIIGVIAELTAEYVLPKLLTILPGILRVRYVLSGFAGAVLTLIIVAMWAYATSSPKT